MKKIIFTIITFISMLNIVKAFDIDVNKIELNNNPIISNLEYKIETPNFNKLNTYNENIKNITQELIDITTKDISKEQKLKEYTKYLYVSDNGFESLGSTIFIETFLDQIEKEKISYDKIKLIRTVEFEDGIISFTYIPNANRNNKKENIVIAYLFKEYNNEYKIHIPWITTEEEIQKRFNNILEEEKDNNIIGGTFKSISLTNNNKEIDNITLEELYNKHKKEVCQINSLYKNEIVSYGSCFFIRSGIVATTMSNFQEYLNKGNEIYINDYEGNSYKIQGVVSASIDYNIAILKLDKEIGTNVTFTNDKLNTDDKVFMINSINNVNSTITYGSFISESNGKLKNLFPINKANVGSAIFTESGNVIAFTTNELINSELSYANSTNYIIDLQNILINTKYEDISYTKLDLFKERFYNPKQEEIISNNIPNKIWNKYKKIGNIEETIPLELIKSNYEDNIISLRYKNKINNSIDTIYIINNYIEELTKNNYKNTYTSKNKLIYSNNKYKIIIKNSMDYLIILIMEI